MLFSGKAEAEAFSACCDEIAMLESKGEQRCCAKLAQRSVTIMALDVTAVSAESSSLSKQSMMNGN